MLEFQNVWKVFETRNGPKEVLRGAYARIRQGEHVGILGRNGAGKSTLLRILAGVERPTSGKVRCTMRMSWPIGKGFGIQSSLSGAANARFIARLYGTPTERTVEFVEDFAELGQYYHEPVRTYSSGMMSRLLMGLSFAVDFDCYLVDEALSTGDARFAEKCRQVFDMRRATAGILLVSHNPLHVKTYCDTAAILRNGMLEFYEDVDEAIAAYQGL